MVGHVNVNLRIHMLCVVSAFLLLRGHCSSEVDSSVAPVAPLQNDPSCYSNEEEDHELSMLQLLQGSFSIISNADATTQSLNISLPTARLESLKPLAWVHLAKTGSTIMNTFFAHEGICPGFPLETLPVSIGPAFGQSWMNKNLPNLCPDGLSLDYPFNTHDGFGPYYKTNRGHGVILLRQPEQRLISGFYDTDPVTGVNYPHGWPYSDDLPKTVLEYAELMQGQAVKMLTREGEARASTPCSYCVKPVSTEEIALAVHRLQNGFAFVGITDEWDLSICLFHHMFGGKCHALELLNMHAGSGNKSDDGLYDTSELYGFRDEHDGVLYREGWRIFRDNLAKYTVTSSSCDTMCTKATEKISTT